MDINSLLQNNMPIDDFEGLSANLIHQLLYHPFSGNSVVSLKNKIDETALDKIPLFRIVETYLQILQREKTIKLTPLGALPKKFVVEIYQKGFLPEYIIESGLYKLNHENDAISIRSARLTAEIAGIVKKVHGKVSLTKKGETFLLPENRDAFFKLFFEKFTTKFNWGYNDGYENEDLGRFGWAYSFFLLNKYGDEPKEGMFYAKLFYKAFPQLFELETRAGNDINLYCYITRVINRFMYWFGFVELAPIEGNKMSLMGDNFYIKTPQVAAVFDFEKID
ncbi:MAG: hypothetical protein ACOVQE_09835 [Chitinophagaceae bacterium]